MKLLLDQGLPRSASDLLRSTGIDTQHVGEIGLTTATDTAILQRAVAEARIVVTLDADFHTLLALSAATAPSVIRIHIERLRAQTAAVVIQSAIAQCEADLEQGAVVTIQEGRLRVRRLPLV